MEAYIIRSPVEIGASIRRQRRINGWSQAELAEKIGKPGSQSQISKWERAEETPVLSSLLELSRAFGGDLFYLFCEHPERQERWDSLKLEGELVVGEDRVPVYSRNEERRHVVSIDSSGLPLPDELDELQEWLPDNAARRLARQVTPRVWLGILYALGAEEGWPRVKLDRIHAAMVRWDEENQGGEEGSGGG